MKRTKKLYKSIFTETDNLNPSSLVTRIYSSRTMKAPSLFDENNHPNGILGNNGNDSDKNSISKWIVEKKIHITSKSSPYSYFPLKFINADTPFLTLIVGLRLR